MKFSFEGHVLDTDTRELRRGSELVEIEPKVLDLLAYLVQNRSRVVSKDDLIAAICDGRPISDAALSSRTYAARRAIGDSGRDQRLIRTLARKGFRFVGTVDGMPGAESASSSIGGPLAAKAQACLAPSMTMPERPVIALLPFSNLSDDPQQEYFSDGISEGLIAALSRLRWFSVIARSSTFMYKGKAVHMREIGNELGAGYVVEGSVRKSGDCVRITAQLNDVGSGSQVWADRYDRCAADMFAVQDEITRAIVSAIEPQLHAAEEFRARSKPPNSMDAWELLMRALSRYGRLSAADHVVAQELLQKAIAIDPEYCQALGVLSASYAFSAHMGWADASVVVPVAESAAVAAVRIDGQDPWAHFALGGVHLLLRRFDEALVEFEDALHLNPSFSHAQNYYATALAFSGRWQDANAAVQRAVQLSPKDPALALNYGSASLAQYIGGNYEDAIRLAKAAIRLRSNYASAHRVLVAAAGMWGCPDLAGATLTELRRAQPNVSCEWIAAHVPLKRQSDLAHYLEGFRRAGLD